MISSPDTPATAAVEAQLQPDSPGVAAPLAASSGIAPVMAPNRHPLRLLLVTVLILGTSIRIILLQHLYLIPDADQSVVGLMARHILQGERPAVSWGPGFAGSAEAYLTAALFGIFGQSNLVLHIVPFVASLMFALLTVLLGWRLYGLQVAVLTGLFLVCAPALLIDWSFGAGSGYLEAMALGTAGLLLVLPANHGLSVGNPLRRQAIACFFLGIAVCVQPLAICFVAAMVVALATTDPGSLGAWQGLRWSALGAPAILLLRAVVTVFRILAAGVVALARWLFRSAAHAAGHVSAGLGGQASRPPRHRVHWGISKGASSGVRASQRPRSRMHAVRPMKGGLRALASYLPRSRAGAGRSMGLSQGAQPSYSPRSRTHAVRFASPAQGEWTNHTLGTAASHAPVRLGARSRGGWLSRCLSYGVLLCAAFCLGASPLVGYNVLHPGAAFSLVPDGATHLDALTKISRLALWAGPVVTGFLPPTTDRTYFLQFIRGHPALYVGGMFLIVLALIQGIATLLGALLRMHSTPISRRSDLIRGLPLVALAATVLGGYMATGLGDEQWAATQPSCLLPLYAAVPLAIRGMLPSVPAVKQWVVAVLTMVGFALTSLYVNCSMPPQRDVGPLANLLTAQHIRAVYGDYSLVYPLAFDSSERLTAVAVNDDLTKASSNRYGPYLAAAASTPNYAWVAATGSVREHNVLACLARLHSSYNISTWADQTVIERPTGGAYPRWNGGRC